MRRVTCLRNVGGRETTYLCALRLADVDVAHDALELQVINLRTLTRSVTFVQFGKRPEVAQLLSAGSGIRAYLLGAGVELRPNLDALGQSGGLLHEGVVPGGERVGLELKSGADVRGGAVHGVLHEQAAARAAALAVIEEEADVGGHDGLVKVSVFEHDEGRLAAELESDLQGRVTAGNAREFEEGGRG